MTQFSYENLGKAVAKFRRLEIEADTTRDEMLFPQDCDKAKPIPEGLVTTYNGIVQQMEVQRELIDHYLITAVSLVEEPS